MPESKQPDAKPADVPSRAAQDREDAFYRDHAAPSGYEVQVVNNELVITPIKKDS